MTRTKNLWVLTLILVLGFATALAAEERGAFERSLKVSGPVELSVQSGSGHITVHAGPAGTVSIHGEIRANWDNAAEKVRRLQQNPPIEQSGNSIHIGKISDEDLRHNVSISYDVVAPADARVTANSGAGSIDISGVKGEVRAETGSGGIHVADVPNDITVRTGAGSINIEDVGGNVTAHTGSGGIHGTALGASKPGPARIAVSTGSGGISLNQVRGSVDGQAGSGHVSISGEPTGDWRIRSGSGGVELKLPAKAAFSLRANTGSGGIHVNYPLTIQGEIGNRHRVEGKVGEGGPLIQVETGSGGVHIGPGGSQAL
jgi:DUF4097 and DUF4098 domain-containing protein YvlB